MPTPFRIPKSLRKARWKLKIQEKETREPPHVSILRGTDKWRINLRTGEFLDKLPDPSEVPKLLLNFIRRQAIWEEICTAWDDKYPDNPVSSNEELSNDDADDSTDAT